VASVVTRQAVRALARLYADQRPGGGSLKFIGNPDVNDLINLAFSENWDRLVAARGHEYYAKKSTAITTAAGTATYNLPADFFELITLGISWNTDRLERVRALNSLDETFLFNGITWGEGTRKAYRLVEGAVELFPTPNAAIGTILRYVPTAPLLTADEGANGSFDGVNGWHRVIALNVAIQMRSIAGRDVGNLVELYERDVERIEALAADRAATAAPMIRDVSPDGYGMGSGMWIDPSLPPPTE
jgi:hypothetical protein